MFQLAPTEWEDLKCQIGTSSWGGDRRALPHVFTEPGVAMLSSVLRSHRAVQVNIEIIRVFGGFSSPTKNLRGASKNWKAGMRGNLESYSTRSAGSW